MFKEERKIVVIEVDKGQRLPAMTAETKDGLRALSHNPYFQYIMTKLHLEKSLVQKALNEGFQLSEKELRYLQAGVYWLSHIESEVSRLTQTTTSPSAPAEPDVIEEFNRVNSALDLIGVEPNA